MVNEKIFFKALLVGTTILVSVLTTTAQDFDTSSVANKDKPKKDILERFYTGGNVGAQFGQYTWISLAPMLGFKITERFSIGNRIQYQYLRDNGPGKYSTNIYGGSIFTRYFVFDNLFAHAEYELMNGNWDYSGKRKTLPFLYLGGGYLFRVSDNVGMGFSALYEVLQRRNRQGFFPIINAGITVGL